MAMTEKIADAWEEASSDWEDVTSEYAPSISTGSTQSMSELSAISTPCSLSELSAPSEP